jgi:hypothetical protein
VTALSSVRRQRTGLMLALTMMVLVAVGGLLYAGGKALARYRGAKNTTITTIAIPVTPVGMLATVDVKNRLTSVAVMVEKPNGHGGGSIVNVPISADTSGVEGQRVALSDAYVQGGADGLTQAVESILTITIDQHAVLGPDELTAVLAPLGKFNVVFPAKVATTDKTGTVTLYPKGPQTLTAKQMTIAMNARVVGQQEAARQPTILALWTAIALANGQGRGIPTAVPPASMNDVVVQLFAGQLLTRNIPVVPLPAGETSDKDVGQLDRADAVFVFATIAPSNMSAANTGLTFRVEAPPGYDDKVKFVVASLLYVNSNVQWVYADGPVHKDTLVFLKDPALSTQVGGPLAIFGHTVINDPTYRIEGVDVIVQLGTDYLTSAAPTTLPATTIAPTTP